MNPKGALMTGTSMPALAGSVQPAIAGPVE